MADFHVFGASLAAVNSIRVLLELGHRVYWQKMGERVLGHFGGIELGSELLDMGMVFLEFGSMDVVRPYNSRFPEEHKALKSFFSKIDVRPAIVKSFYGGVLADDIVIADNLGLIKGQHFNSLSVQNHPNKKWANEYFEQHSYETVCSNMYPEFYKRFLHCFAKKITSSQQQNISARYHRAAWLPLYYPETINRKTRNLLPYPFHRPQKKSIAAHMQNIVAQVEKNPNCILPEVPDDVSLQQRLFNLKHVTRDKVILGCSPEKLLAEWSRELDGHILRPNLNIGFFRAKKTSVLNIDCINDLDHPFVFRVFIQESTVMANYSIISVEFSEEWKNKEQANMEVQRYLNSLDIFSEIEPIKLINGIRGPAFPRCGAEPHLLSLKSRINEKYRGCTIHGMSHGFNQTSMNAQLLSSARVGKRSCL